MELVLLNGCKSKRILRKDETRQIKNNDKSKKYILRGQRNTRYHERNLINFFKRIISFSIV